MDKVYKNRYQELYINNENRLIIDSAPGIVTLISTVGGILLIEHERMNTISLETVRGYIEDGEDPKDAAIREAHEELGIDEDSIININQLGKVNPDNSYTNQAVYCFSMQLDYKGSIDEAKLQKEEGILSVKWYPREDIPGMILDGKINDGITISAFAFQFAGFLDNGGRRK